MLDRHVYLGGVGWDFAVISNSFSVKIETIKRPIVLAVKLNHVYYIFYFCNAIGLMPSIQVFPPL